MRIHTNRIVGAIVSGGASGIGRELVRELQSHHGIKVLAIDINNRGLQDLKDEVGCDILVADITKSSFLEEFSDIDFNKFNWLINNAGLGYASNFNNSTQERYTKEIEMNIFTTVHLSHIFISKLGDKFGIITNLSSSSAFQPLPKMSVYSATKAFVLNFSLATSKELEKSSNILMNVVIPSGTNTNFQNAGGVLNSSPEKLLTAKKVAITVIKKTLNYQRIISIGNRALIMNFMSRLLPYEIQVYIWYRAMNKLR